MRMLSLGWGCAKVQAAVCKVAELSPVRWGPSQHCIKQVRFSGEQDLLPLCHCLAPLLCLYELRIVSVQTFATGSIPAAAGIELGSSPIPCGQASRGAASWLTVPACLCAQEAMRQARQKEQLLSETRDVCNETVLALWEECKPCLKQTCMRFYSKTCHSGSGLVGRQVSPR